MSDASRTSPTTQAIWREHARFEYRVPNGRPHMSRNSGQSTDLKTDINSFGFFLFSAAGHNTGEGPDHALAGSSKRLDGERFDPANNNENRDVGRNTSQSYRNVTIPLFFVICLVVLGRWRRILLAVLCRNVLLLRESV